MRSGIAGLVLGFLLAVPFVPALAQTSCAQQVEDLQSVVHTLIVYTTELVREVDAIKSYGAQAVPVVGAGVVSSGAVTGDAVAGSTADASIVDPQIAIDKQKAGIRARNVAPKIYLFVGNPEGSGVPGNQNNLTVQISNYFTDESVAVQVNGVTIQPKNQECGGRISGFTLTLCSWIAYVPIPNADVPPHVVISYRDTDQSFDPNRITGVNANWNGTSWVVN